MSKLNDRLFAGGVDEVIHHIGMKNQLQMLTEHSQLAEATIDDLRAAGFKPLAGWQATDAALIKDWAGTLSTLADEASIWVSVNQNALNVRVELAADVLVALVALYEVSRLLRPESNNFADQRARAIGAAELLGVYKAMLTFAHSGLFDEVALRRLRAERASEAQIKANKARGDDLQKTIDEAKADWVRASRTMKRTPWASNRARQQKYGVSKQTLLRWTQEI